MVGDGFHIHIATIDHNLVEGTVGFHNEIPTGALLLVSDNPMVPEGVKTEESDKQVSKNYVGEHLRIGIDSLRQLINNGITVKHLKF